jgi:UDPglucose 6-dehydrogenase
MNIAVAGMGYAGLSNAALLAQHNTVVALDVLPEKVTLLGQMRSPIEEAELQDFLNHKPVAFSATLDKQQAYADVIVANRVMDDLADVMGKAYTRDVFGKD